MFAVLLVIMLFIGLVLIARPLTVIFHELGHAIPALLMTKKAVTVYIGSFGDPSKSLKLELGLLTIYFRYNLFEWRLGLCVPSDEAASINKLILITLCGPLASLIIAGASFYFSLAYDFHGFIKLFLVVFLGSSLFDILANLIPIQTPIELYDGRKAYNDGYSLLLLFYYKKFPKEYSKAVLLYNEKKFTEAADLFSSVLLKKKDEYIYMLAIYSYLQVRNYKMGKELSDVFAKTYKMNADDFSNMAISYSQLGFHEEGLKYYDESLQLNPHHKHSLNNKGYTLTLLEKYKEAVPLFDRAIDIDKDFFYSYNNRGFSKIKLGQTEEGLKDISHAFELAPHNSYGHKYLGIYHFDKGEYAEALKLFEKAKEQDEFTYGINDLITETKTKLTEM